MVDARGDRSVRPRDVGRSPVGRVRPAGRAGWASPDRGPADPLRRKGEADAWNAFSLVLAGMLLWGGLGWLAGRVLHAPVLTGVGLMVGTAGGLALVWLRYGRSNVISGEDGGGTPGAGGSGRTRGRTP